MKKRFNKKYKSIAERKIETQRRHKMPYGAIGLSILLWLIVTALFFGHGMARPPDLAEGQKAPSTIMASVDFECENLHETSFNRNKAAEAVPPIFVIDPSAAERASGRIRIVFERIAQYTTVATNQRPVIIDILSEFLHGSKVNASDLIAVFPAESIVETSDFLIKSIAEVMSSGILSDEYHLTLFSNASGRMLTIARDNDTAHRTVAQQDIYSPRQAVWSISDRFTNEYQRAMLNRLLPLFVNDNLVYDEDATIAVRRKAAANVLPVIEQYPAGSTLIRAGEPVTPQTLRMFKQHEEQRRIDQNVWERTLETFGNALLLLAGLIITAVMLHVVTATKLHPRSGTLLLAIFSLLTLGSARLLTYFSVEHTLIPPSMTMYLVPYALAVLLAGILLNGSTAIILGFWCSFAAAVLFGQSFNVFTLGILITVTATSTARNVHRRASLFRAGLWICAVKVLYVLVSAILNRPLMSVLLGQMSASVLSGMLTTVLTLLLIPIFEKLFRITTDITLLELSDMGHPLLRKMAIQAPGTYHHSLMVATLAQNAAEAIGASSLLARVCAYYHDIGKMAKPEFFAENIQYKDNPHDALSPRMSARVISAHVREGLILAKCYKLPPPILDAIEQHHGNGLISYFYHKAKQLQIDAKPGMENAVNDADFRYGGAPAVSPEMAILSLADATEAAARSIRKPTPQKITHMMDNIFFMKIRDGQMNHADLTMAQMIVVKQSFIFTLCNMLHGRIQYPKSHANNTFESAELPFAPTAKTAGTGGVAG